MGIENFISDALCHPSDYISYYVSRKLAELHPDKSIIDSDMCAFDLEAYVRAGLCALVKEPVIFSHVETNWRGMKRKLGSEADNAWLNVLWQGHLIDVVFITWTDDGCKSRHYWIVADGQKIAEDFFRAVCEWCAEVRGEVLVFDNGDFEKNEELFGAIKAANFDNLVLPCALKQEIQNDFAHFFASRAMYERYRIPWKRGVLLIGPPGNGKTHTVKALINQTKQPCLYVKSFKSRHGSEQDGMRRVFARARHTTPCILVLEDIDSLIDGKNRSFFLNELDGFSTNTGMVVLATTNHPERLDTAILDRPSRFDRKYYFELPAAAERFAYIAAWNMALQREMCVSEEGVAKIVAQTESFSFAYMKELFLSSMMQWMSAPAPASMDAVVVDRARRLREQMKSQKEEPVSHSHEETDDED
jgi:pimeloyl-ACP methyl ester carboxylesterase